MTVMSAVDTESAEKPSKPPTASLLTIPIKSHSASARKSGDLTRRAFEPGRFSASPIPPEAPAPPVPPTPRLEAFETKAAPRSDLPEEPIDDRTMVVAPSIEMPATEAPDVAAQGAEAAAVDMPAVETAPSEEPAFEVPGIEEPAIEEPVDGIAAIEEPAYGIAAIEEPAIEEPAVGADAMDESAMDESAIRQPVFPIEAMDELAIKEPTIDMSAIPKPATQDRSMREPVLDVPGNGAAPPEPRDVLDYWRRKRGQRAYPAASDLDRDLIAQRWPDTWLLDFTKVVTDLRAEPSLARVTRLGAPGASSEAELEYSTYLTEWIIELGGAALSSGRAVEEVERVSTRSGPAHYRVRALPLGPVEGLPDHVLCELSRAESSSRFGRKRTWISD